MDTHISLESLDSALRRLDGDYEAILAILEQPNITEASLSPRWWRTFKADVFDHGSVVLRKRLRVLARRWEGSRPGPRRTNRFRDQVALLTSTMKAIKQYQQARRLCAAQAWLDLPVDLRDRLHAQDLADENGWRNPTIGITDLARHLVSRELGLSFNTVQKKMGGTKRPSRRKKYT